MTEELSKSIKNDMKISSNWMTFHCVLIFIVTAFMVYSATELITFLLSTPFRVNINMKITLFSLILMIIILLFVSISLIKYAQSLSKASKNGDLILLEKGMKNYKVYTIISTIIALIGLIYVIANWTINTNF